MQKLAEIHMLKSPIMLCTIKATAWGWVEWMRSEWCSQFLDDENFHILFTKFIHSTWFAAFGSQKILLASRK